MRDFSQPPLTGVIHANRDHVVALRQAGRLVGHPDAAEERPVRGRRQTAGQAVHHRDSRVRAARRRRQAVLRHHSRGQDGRRRLRDRILDTVRRRHRGPPRIPGHRAGGPGLQDAVRPPVDGRPAGVHHVQRPRDIRRRGRPPSGHRGGARVHYTAGTRGEREYLHSQP